MMDMLNFSFDELNKLLEKQSDEVDDFIRDMDKKEAEEKKIQLDKIEEEEEINFTDSMKKLVVTSKCVACGLCVEMSDFIEEDAEGKAIVKGAGIIPNDELENIDMIINLCPERALKLRNAGIVKSKGKNGLKELKELIISEFKDYKVPVPSSNWYSFKEESHNIERPYSSKQNNYDYTSYDRAMSAGLSEFNRIMYGERRAIIQKLLVEYKTRALDSYIYDKKEEGNYYYDISMNVTKRIQTYLAQIRALVGERVIDDEGFCNMIELPIFGYEGNYMERDAYVYQLRHLEEVWITDKIMGEVKSLSWFDTYVDVDDIEDYRGKDKYCFKIYEAIDELRDQILSETSWVLNSSDGVQYILEQNFKKITEKINEEINLKINNLISTIDKLYNGDGIITDKSNSVKDSNNSKDIKDSVIVKVNNIFKRY